MRASGTPEQPGEDDTVPPRQPYWAVGLALLGLVIVVLIGASVLNARLRPSAGIEGVTSSVTTPTTARPVIAGSAVASTLSVSGTPAANLDSKQAVAKAYLRYWDIYNDALYTLDTTRLGDVMSGEELSRVQKQIDGLRSRNQAVKSDVQHHYVVVNVSPGKAGVQDKFLDKSYLVDLKTKRALQSPGDGKTETIACQLQIIDGTWKVVSVVRVQQ